LRTVGVSLNLIVGAATCRGYNCGHSILPAPFEQPGSGQRGERAGMGEWDFSSRPPVLKCVGGFVFHVIASAC